MMGALPYPKHVCRIGDIDWSDNGDAPPTDHAEAGGRQVEPWLSAILQAEHLSLLVGNGLTTAAVGLAGGKPVQMDATVALPKDVQANVEEAATSEAKAMGRGEPNIEDRLRAALLLESAFRILKDERAKEVRSGVEAALELLCTHVLTAEKALLDEVEDPEDDARYTAAGYLVAFLLAFASRTPTRDRLHVFTTNYDRLIEHACERAGLRVLDRFVGTLRPRFRSSRLDVDVHYSPPGIRGEPRFLEGVLRLTKLHGSVDWQVDDGSVVRAGMDFGLVDAAKASAMSSLLVYPQSSKDVETGLYPYADLFRDLSAAVCRPNSVVVTYGYGFGDDHINRVLADMLTLPSTHLVAIAYSDVGNRIASFVENNDRHRQVSLLLGPHFGDLRTLVDHYLPRPAIDDITWRRANLLRRRAVPGLTTPSSDEVGEADVHAD